MGMPYGKHVSRSEAQDKRDLPGSCLHFMSAMEVNLLPADYTNKDSSPIQIFLLPMALPSPVKFV